MDYKEACHRLRISPRLLKWYGTYAAKGDGRKLQEVAPGEFDPVELDEFDAHLNAPWNTRKVPAGTHADLLVEASGRCALCSEPCESLEIAHIRRKGVEVVAYIQHHGNLIPLCGSCHNRYDDPNLKTVSFEVIEAAKETIVSRKMEAIDRDVQIARGVRLAIEETKRQLRAEAATPTVTSNVLLWGAYAGRLLGSAAQSLPRGSGMAVLLDPSSPAQSLEALGESLEPALPLTHRLLGSYALEARGETAETPDDWELLEPEHEEHECSLCGVVKDTVDYDCQNCGHFGSNTDPPERMQENDAGVLVPVYSDARGDEYVLTCEQCESDDIEISYPEAFCARCSHMLSKDD